MRYRVHFLAVQYLLSIVAVIFGLIALIHFGSMFFGVHITVAAIVGFVGLGLMYLFAYLAAENKLIEEEITGGKSDSNYANEGAEKPKTEAAGSRQDKKTIQTVGRKSSRVRKRS